MAEKKCIYQFKALQPRMTSSQGKSVPLSLHSLIMGILKAKQLPPKIALSPLQNFDWRGLQ